MRKTPSLFIRDWDGDRRLVLPIVNPEAKWVCDGEGMATKKFDGTCVLVGWPCAENGMSSNGDGCLGCTWPYWKRYDAKHCKTAPKDFVPIGDADPVTGHWTGWVPIMVDDPASKWHMDAIVRQDISIGEILSYYPAGTYELCGPKIGGNPEAFENHILVRHGEVRFPNFPTDYEGIRAVLAGQNIEGIVWHHPDGRMAKIKKSDFGLKRK